MKNSSGKLTHSHNRYPEDDEDIEYISFNDMAEPTATEMEASIATIDNFIALCPKCFRTCDLYPGDELYRDHDFKTPCAICREEVHCLIVDLDDLEERLEDEWETVEMLHEQSNNRHCAHGVC